MLTIYKASAGSGKTFQLVVEYLKLLLENPFNYKHILAVTFTNKATNEMKTRILEQLNALANNEDSDYIAPLQKGNNHTEDFIRERAKLILKNILHDYNRFSISTIDSFTQRTIKAFNRELGIAPNFRVELDSDMILAEATDRLLSKIGKDKKLLKWLREFSKEKIEENYSQHIDEDIKALGKELFKENFQVFFPDESESVYSRENLDGFAKTLRKIKSSFENTLSNFGKNAMAAIEQNGLHVADFAYGTSGVAGFLQKISEGEIKEPGARALQAADNVEKWYTKSSTKKAQLQALAENELRPLLAGLLTFINENIIHYNSADAVQKQLRMLGILTDLKEEIKLLLHEKSILQMSDSNLLLSKIIGRSDSPFIYEKTGSYYKHFMLDEFQDTSGLQWNNFKPLVANSLAEGNSNLIVGDVKQSIYRWRNSDWRILAEQVNMDFNELQYKEFSLDFNWRSDKNIIEFNNRIFEQLKTGFENHLLSNVADPDNEFVKKFKHIYSDIAQKPGKQGPKTGLVNVNFLDPDDFIAQSTATLLDQVKQLQDSGIKASEIAILIRKNKEGAAIVDTFLNAAKQPENRAYNLSVLSNESLFLHASRAVNFVIGVVELLIDPNKEITKVALLNHWQSWIKPELAKRGKTVKMQDGQTETAFGGRESQKMGSDYEINFKIELQHKIDLIGSKVLLSSLDETIMQICSVFRIFEIETELPFLQTLIDKAAELKTTLSNDLSNLLFWWKENGYKTSVNVNEDVDSIRLLTIHKSKGLEYKAVLIPYFDWSTALNGRLASVIWCRPKTAPFNQFPLLPVKAGKQMEQSVFSDEYYEERVNSFIDTFNLIYVGFTRAKSVLVINSPKPADNKKRGTESSTQPVNFLLQKALEELAKTPDFSGSWNSEQTAFSFGCLPSPKNVKENPQPLYITHYEFNDFEEKTKLRLSGEDFLVAGTQQNSIKNTGKIIHELLAGVVSANDVENACLKAFHKGIVTKKEMGEIQQTLRKSIENPAIAPWFDGSFTVLNERNLLTADRVLRPDRIMVSGDEAIVVDYKTGDQKSENYNRQVKRYARVLKETGFKKVEGFLWYINQNEVEKVCEL